MTPLIPIGRFAQLTELTVRALRFYDELGLLDPGHIDDYSGYRYYQPQQLERAHLIGRFEDIAFAYRHLWTQITAAGFTPTGNPREIYATPLDRPAEEYQTEVVWPIRGRPAPPPSG